MDSFNNALYSASHAIWGETHPEHIKKQQQEQHGDEPLSGVEGKGVADDPFDGGNRDIQPGISAEPEVFTTPIGYDAPELSAAVNSENYESQLGGEETAATGATAGPTGWYATRIPMGPEDPPFGTDPVSTDATALSSTLNKSGGGGGGGGGGGAAMGVPRIPRQPMDSTGLNRDIGPSIGAVNQKSGVNPASIGGGTAGLDEFGDFENENAPSDKCVRGLDIGGGSSGETSDRVEDTPVEKDSHVEEPTADGVEGVGGEGEGEGGDGDDEVYAQVPSVPGNGPSKEALRGPSAPPAREEYEFERNMSQIKPAHTKPKAHKAAKSATEDHPQKANVMSKMKERFGRAGNHLHHTNKT